MEFRQSTIEIDWQPSHGRTVVLFPACGYWEAKDSANDLDVEIKRKFQAGYPKENIIFQAPERAVVVQDGNRVFDGPITQPEDLVEALRVFFTYQPPAFERWQEAVGEFKNEVPKLAQALIALIEGERRANKKFIAAFDTFATLCGQVSTVHNRNEAWRDGRREQAGLQV